MNKPVNPNSILTPRDVDYILDRYRKRIADNGLTFASMNSGTLAKQTLRHRIHRQVIGDNATILDVGCGLGDFFRLLRETGFNGVYTGCDIVPDYVAYCSQTFPDATFKHANVLETGFPGEFDVIVASQVFNARYPYADNLAVVRSFIEEAFANSNHAVSIDLLTSHVDYHEEYLYNYVPEEMFSFAKRLTRLVSLRHDYLPFEFTLQLFHDSGEKNSGVDG